MAKATPLVAKASPVEADAVSHNKIVISDTRPIAPIALPPKLKPATVSAEKPEVRNVAPTELRVEPSYQRDLSGKSIKLIRHIVEKWDWSKFKPPVCAETGEGLFVIDGQHTAIAAASHPTIVSIPVIVVSADRLESRAEAFVSHNRDRLAMSPLQVFHAEVAANKPEAFAILKIAIAAGCEIPRYVPARGTSGPGHATAITAMQRIYRVAGEQVLARVLRIARAAEVTPIASTVAYGLQLLLKAAPFAAAAAMPDEKIAAAMKKIRDIEGESQAFGSETGQNRYRACAVLIAKACGVAVAAPALPKERTEGEAVERLRQLENALVDNSWMPFAWSLTPTEGAILNVMVLRRVATKEAIHTIVYGDAADGGPDPKIIDVLVCKMRPKLEPVGIEIETVWGQGYALTEKSRAIVAALQTARAA